MIFLSLLFILYLSQLFLISPGTVNVDSLILTPEANTIILGLSSSSLASILLISYCLIWLVRYSNNSFSKNDVFILFALSIFTLVNILVGILEVGVTSTINIVLKLLMPFIIYFYIKHSFNHERIEAFYKTIVLINVLMIGQVLACKLFTGSFSANRFYWYIMEEEYYGFYNSPHPFAALLGLLAIWNVKCLIMKKSIKTNSALLIANVSLILLSGVRTYLVGFIISLFIIYLSGLLKRNRFKYWLLIFSSIVFFFGILFSWEIKEFFYMTRFGSILDSDSNVSSGRGLRWEENLAYYVNYYDVLEKIVGQGFGSVYEINQAMNGVHINSLNAFIDLLLDNGILGTFLLTISYIYLFRSCVPKNSSSWIHWAFLFYLFFGLMINNILPYVTIMPLGIMFLAFHKIDEINSKKVSSDSVVKRNGISNFNY